MIRVYQIVLSDADQQLLESEGWGANEKIEAYADRMFDSRFKAESFRFYEAVAIVDADDMEEAFRLMNLWRYPERVQKLRYNVPSMSVGDILEQDGEFYRVASWGFSKLDEDEND